MILLSPALFLFFFLFFLSIIIKTEPVKNDIESLIAIYQQKIISLSLARVFLLAPLNIDYEKVLRFETASLVLEYPKKRKRCSDRLLENVDSRMPQVKNHTMYAIFFATRYSKTGIAAKSEGVTPTPFYSLINVISYKQKYYYN